MARFRTGVRVQYSDGVIYRVMPDGSHRREDGGGPGKKERKAAKKNRACRLKNHKIHRVEKDKVHRLEACVTGVEK